MSTKKIDAATKHAMDAFLKKIAVHYNVMGAILFGSRARLTHRQDSDADVAILLKGVPNQFIETKLALDDFAFEVLLDTGILIQPLPIWQTEWDHPEKYRNPRLIENIHREGIQL